MDMNIINPFINATSNVLETMAFVVSEAGKPYVKKDDVAKGDVSVLLDSPDKPVKGSSSVLKATSIPFLRPWRINSECKTY